MAVKERLVINTIVNGHQEPFMGGLLLTEYTLEKTRMGMPTLKGKIKHATCLDDYWTGEEFVTCQGERFYIRNTPSSQKASDDTRYVHEIEFESERNDLAKKLFFDVVAPNSLTEFKPRTNSTEFSFYGSIKEYIDRLNCCLAYMGMGDSVLRTTTCPVVGGTHHPVGNGWCVMWDQSGGYDGDLMKEVSFTNEYIWDAITAGNNAYEIPFAVRGRQIVFGEKPVEFGHVFKYGHNDALTSIKKNPAGNLVINEITALGSSENIPYYYPNETEYGEIRIVAGYANRELTSGMIEVVKLQQMVSKTRALEPIVFHYDPGGSANPPSAFSIKTQDSNTWVTYNIGQELTIPKYGNGDGKRRVSFRMSFTATEPGDFRIRLVFWFWQIGDSFTGGHPYDLTASGAIENIICDNQGPHLTADKVEYDRDAGVLVVSVSRAISWDLQCDLVLSAGEIKGRCHEISVTAQNASKSYWTCGDTKLHMIGEAGIKINGTLTHAANGDSFMWESVNRVQTMTRLTVPKYRQTLGAERFYKALNNVPYTDPYYDAYVDPEAETPYVFPNPYSSSKQTQYVYENEDIKPTIEGMRNTNGQYFGEIAGVAFDADDNDSLKSGDKDSDNAEYEHSFFYIKLNRLNYRDSSGQYDLDLFNSASFDAPMTIQMTSGRCAGCKFEIQTYETKKDGLVVWQNPVQVENGDIVPGNYADKVKGSNIQPAQQNTAQRSIWIAVKKDTNTFGEIMPNRTNSYFPQGPHLDPLTGEMVEGDKFNIINIDLPKIYVLAAEKRLERAMMDYLRDNNEERFSFEISCSRIFWAQNPQLYSTFDENGMLVVEHGGRRYKQYISSVTYEAKDSEPLPDIKVTLADEIATNSTFAQRVAASAATLVPNPGTLAQLSLDSATHEEVQEVASRKMSKKEDDRSEGTISTDKGFQVGSFVRGVSGGQFVVDDDGNTSIETDYIRVRKKIFFEDVEIVRAKNLGGAVYVTPGGGAVISYVEQDSSGDWTCYFKTSDSENQIAPQFQPSDFIYCKSSNTISNGSPINHWYWYEVAEVGENYITLYGDICAPGSDIPQVGDVIVQFGNENDRSRQNAIVISAIGEDAPKISLYRGVDYCYGDPQPTFQVGVSEITGVPFLNNYGDMYVGAADRSTYISYDSTARKMNIKARIDAESTVDDMKLAEYVADKNPGVLYNLLEGTNQGLNHWIHVKASGVDSSLSQVDIDGVSGVKLLTSQNITDPTKYNQLSFKTDMFDVKIGEVLCISCDIKSTARSGTLGLCLASAGSWTNYHYTEITPGQWIHVNAKVTVNSLSETDWMEVWVIDSGRRGLMYKSNALYIKNLKVERGPKSTQWMPSLKEILTRDTSLDYLKDALEQSTNIDGGLIQTSLVQLGYKSDGTFVPMAGTSGLYSEDRPGGGLAVWAGGSAIDASAPNMALRSDRALAVIRMDGTAYFADNTVRFGENRAELGDNVYLTKDGFFATNSSNNDTLQIGNVSIGDVSQYINQSTIPLSTFFSLTPTVYLPSSPDQLAFTALVGESRNIPIGNSALAANSSISGTITVSGTFPAGAYSGRVGIKIKLANEIKWARIFSINPGADHRVSTSLKFNYITDAIGEYKMEVFFPDAAPAGSVSHGTTTMSFAVSGKVSMGIGSRTVIGNDGFASIWQNAAVILNGDPHNPAVLLRTGDTMIRLNNDGLRFSFDGNTWKKLKDSCFE